jgi:two-component system, cell cycle sensor histidine kinase and response regulator CckA
VDTRDDRPEHASEPRPSHAELEAAKAHFSHLFEHAPVGYLSLSEPGLILEANIAVASLLGVPQHGLVGQSITRYILPADQALYRLYRQQLPENGKPRACELRIVRGDGAEFWARLDATVAQEPGAAAACLIALSDISGSKQAEIALQERADLLGEAQIIVGIGTYVLDVSTGRWKSSDELDRLFGIDQAYDCSVEGWAALVHPDDRQMMVDYFGGEVVGQGRAFNKEYRIIRHNDRAERWVHGLGKLTFDAQGRPVRMLGTILDITDRRRAEEEKARLEAQLQHARKMESVGRLAGGVAHDFNNMLSVILGYAEIAIERVDPAQPLHADLVEIREAAVRSADLTRQLLAFARKQTVAPRVLNLNETVAGMLKILKRLIGEDIELDWQPGAGLWPVRMDPSQIDQILANLCINSRDAISGVGRIAIETRNVVLDEAFCSRYAGCDPGEYVLVAVSDDGRGMDQDSVARVFEPFFTSKSAGRGTGLGLATVYGAVKQNNGIIEVRSELGQGTTLSIYLPRHAGETGPARGEAGARTVVRGNETILLVEDEPSILKLVETVLQLEGYHVLAADTPGGAIRLAREHAGDVHLLMTDVVMPEMNGRDLAKNLLSLYPNLRCLFMSGYTADVIAHRGVLDEGVQFIQKPFSGEGLAIKVREALEHSLPLDPGT